MNKAELWTELHDLFDTDDGSLPEIKLENLDRWQIGDIFSYLISIGKDVTRGGGVLWDNELNRERPISSVENAALLVTEHKVSPFHIVISCADFNETTIPDLGVFVSRGSITLDYRKGLQWKYAELEALFRMLNQLKIIAPDMQVSLWPYETEITRNKFQKVWNQYRFENEI